MHDGIKTRVGLIQDAYEDLWIIGSFNHYSSGACCLLDIKIAQSNRDKTILVDGASTLDLKHRSIQLIFEIAIARL
jgi:hypothetical protein